MRLVLGSRNVHKLRELGNLLAPNELEPLPGGVELPPETGSSFAENALSKARAAAALTGQPALGEDSGIVVPALGNAPGPRSARFAGEDASDEQNLRKLLCEMEGAGERGATYVCALAFAEPGGDERLFEGTCAGRLSHEPRGSGGFGYDPIFVPDEAPVPGITMASLSAEQKNAMSHRGNAARLLLDWLSSRT